MSKKHIIIVFQLIILFSPLRSQVKKTDSDLKREVTLYNPYRPSLTDARKKSYLPEIVDTATIKPVFKYQVVSNPFTPTYTISQIKSAALLPDPLPRLYKSYLKLGLGNNNTPLGELSITNLRSKKGAIGFYASHYSSNGKVKLDNDQRVFAGFMDNDASLFGKKFFKKSYLGIQGNYLQRIRYPYGFNPEGPVAFDKKEIKLNYSNFGVAAAFASVNPDSSEMYYNFKIAYDYFTDTKDRRMNHIGFGGAMAGLYKGFYFGSEINIDHYRFSDPLNLEPRYILSLNPFVKKNTAQWNFKAGFIIAGEKNPTGSGKAYFYPDLEFGFSMVPEYLRFFAQLTGKLENNEPLKVISQNPYLVPDGSVFKVPNTDHSLIMSAGLKGNNGLGGNYLASVNYSIINNFLLYSNIVYPDTASRIEQGNHFIVVPDDIEILNLHGEFNGNFTSKVSFNTSFNYYKYSLSVNDYAWNKPEWDGKFGLIYNLRNKIIAGTELTAIGSRKLMISKSPTGWMTLAPEIVEEPVHFNLGISAEYRYTKILSFWFKINNISWRRYYEWAYYPSQMFNFMLGFSYSL